MSTQRPTRPSRPLVPTDLVVGGQVEYYSESYDCWIPTMVNFVNSETGALRLDIKPDHLFDLVEQKAKLRQRTRPSAEQLEWVRKTLREDRADAEAQALFQRHATGSGRSALLTAERMGDAGNELDILLGVSGCYCSLRKAANGVHFDSDGLEAELFSEVFWELLWKVQRDHCQAMTPDSERTRENVEEVYEIGSILGRGSFGVVKLARHRVTRTEVALKSINKAMHGMSSAELQMEIERLCLLDHPHIVKLYEHFEDDTRVYLSMDYCSGGELRTVVSDHEKASRIIPEEFIAHVMRQVLMAIAHIHSRGVVHLDLKSTNIMLMRNPGMPTGTSSVEVVQAKPHAMVIDLGVARLFRPGNFRFNQPTGTPMTMAPEVWNGEIHPKADVFSLGVVLFEVMSLTFPFCSGSDHARAIRYWGNRPTPPWHNLKTPSEHGPELLQRMLLLDRHVRPTAAACLNCPFLKETGQPAGLDQSLRQRLLHQLGLAGERNVLHRSVALSLAREWPANQLPDIKEAFCGLDSGRSGRFTHDQMASALLRLGMDVTKARRVAEAMDLTRDGTVSWTEFVAACINLGSSTSEPVLRRVFDKANEKADGLLNQKDIRRLLAPGLCSETTVRDLFVELVGREESGARVDWPTFYQHFRTEDGEDGLEHFHSLAAVQSGGEAEAATPAVDFFEQARMFLEGAREAVFVENSQKELGPPNEEDIRTLAMMGFTNREKCIAALRKYHNKFSDLVIHELCGKSTIIRT